MSIFIIFLSSNIMAKNVVSNERSSNYKKVSNTKKNDVKDTATKETFTKPANWYIRIVAEDITRDITSNSAQLGQIDVPDAVQKHSLQSFNTFNDYLDVLFVDPSGLEEGQYKTNYHVFEENTEEQWTFTVMSDDDNITISLYCHGLYLLTPYEDANRLLYSEYRSSTHPLMKYMKLVDTQTNVEMPAMIDNEVQTYTFSMDGSTERTFKWVMELEEIKIPKGVSKAASGKKIKKNKTFSDQRKKHFDLDTPPFKLKEKR